MINIRIIFQPILHTQNFQYTSIFYFSEQFILSEKKGFFSLSRLLDKVSPRSHNVLLTDQKILKKMFSNVSRNLIRFKYVNKIYISLRMNAVKMTHVTYPHSNHFHVFRHVIDNYINGLIRFVLFIRILVKIDDFITFKTRCFESSYIKINLRI